MEELTFGFRKKPIVEYVFAVSEVLPVWTKPMSCILFRVGGAIWQAEAGIWLEGDFR